MKKSNDRWGDAHIRLRKLFEERAGMSQLDFAERYGLGTQGMVWQYLSGYRPLNYEAAAKFATGLGCRIDDFSPEMAQALRSEILPVLGRVGKSLAKAAIFISLAVPPLLPEPGFAATFVAAQGPLVIMLNRMWRRLRHGASYLCRVAFALCREFAYMTSAWLTRSMPLSAEHRSAARRPPSMDASACSWRTSPPIWPMSTPISLRPFATH